MSTENTHKHDTGHIYQSLFSNLAIALLKGVAAFMTGSGSMLAETLHSFADCGNQILLLVGVRRASRPANDKHPLGHGRALYFWSFMVALLLFSGGGLYSIYEGAHTLMAPEPVEHVSWALGILGGSFLLEGWSLWGNVREMNARRGSRRFMRYLRDSKDSDLIVVFGENLAAVVGLFVAFAAILASSLTGDGRFDAVGSLLIGAVLIGVALFLAAEIKSLLIGEAADPELVAVIELEAEADPRILGVGHLVTVQQGPGEVIVAVRLRFSPELTAAELMRTLRAFEDRVRLRAPEVRWCFTEPMPVDEPPGPDPLPTTTTD